MDVNLLQIIMTLLAALLSSLSTGGGVLWYVKRNLDLQFKEREAEIEDRKSDNKTFEGVVETFRMAIVNEAEVAKERTRSQEAVAKERNRIQSQMMTDHKQFVTETLSAMQSLKAEISNAYTFSAQSATELLAEQQKQKKILEGFSVGQKTVQTKLDGIKETAEKIEQAVTAGTQDEILRLVKKLIDQASGQVASEKKDDPVAAENKE